MAGYLMGDIGFCPVLIRYVARPWSPSLVLRLRTMARCSDNVAQPRQMLAEPESEHGGLNLAEFPAVLVVRLHVERVDLGGTAAHPTTECSAAFCRSWRQMRPQMPGNHPLALAPAVPAAIMFKIERRENRGMACLSVPADVSD